VSLAGQPGDVMCSIMSPHAQIYIKETFREWRPDLPWSDKHRADIARLHEAPAPSGA
jgi:hypothetical protein